MATDRADVVIIGASVAGCACALGLARRGFSVVLVDKATFPRDKPCGEGILPHGLRELHALGLLAGIEPLGRPFRGIGYHVDGIDAVGRFPSGHGLGIRRLRLDAHLVERCGGTDGIDVRTATAAREVHVDERGADVLTDAGPIRARAVIGADGLHSAQRKAIGAQVRDTRPLRFGARLHAELADGIAMRDVVDVHLAEGFEVYVTPTGEREVNLAILCGRDVSRTLGGDLDGGLWRLLHGVRGLGPSLEGARQVSAAALTGPLRQAASALAADRRILVGDAAGFLDAITGEGMSLSLIGARIAVEVLAKGLADDRLDRAALASYEVQVRDRARSIARFTELVLWWVRHRALARRVVGLFAARPSLFGRVLAIPSGDGSVLDLLRG